MVDRVAGHIVIWEVDPWLVGTKGNSAEAHI